jgi:putative tricarboxylic transport membrane protein
MKAANADRLTGILGIVLATTYVSHARGIEDSLLADEVGVAGVPTAVGALVMVASIALLVKGILAARQGSAASQKDSEKDPGGDSEAAQAPGPKWRADILALSLLGVLVAYVLLLPLAGYVLSLGMMIAAIAWLVGARAPRTVALSALGGALGLYLLFTVILQIRMPPGLWPAWMGT